MKTHNGFARHAICRLLLSVLWLGPLVVPAGAQIVFSASDIQSHIGESRQAYVSTNINSSGWSLLPGGPQQWDFSQPPGTNESIQRYDIVPISDAQNTSMLTDPTDWAKLTNATFSERVTSDTTPGSIAWTFETVDAQDGFLDYGLFNQAPTAFGSLYGFTFYEPRVQLLPNSAQMGTSWSYVGGFTNVLVGQGTLSFITHLTVSNYVDAFGTVILPQIGSVPALRFIEYYQAENIVPVFETNYIWLVRGIGLAVELSFYQGTFELTNTLIRIFQASSMSGTQTQISVKNGQLTLNWGAAGAAAGYTVESLDSLSSTNWQVQASVTSNRWSIPLPVGQTQQFFRILLNP